MLRSSCLAWMLPMKHICYLSYNRSGCSSWILFITVVIQAHASSAGCQSRFSFSFLPKRGQNEIVWAIGGGEASMYSRAKHVANLGRPAGGHAPGNGDFESFNLVESGTAGTHTTTIFQTVYSLPSWSHAYLCSFSRYEGCLWIRVLRFWHTVLVRMGDMNIHILGYLTQELWRMRAYPPLHV